MPVVRDAQGRPFSMMACPYCAAAGPHLPDAGEDAVFACFRCSVHFPDAVAARR